MNGRLKGKVAIVVGAGAMPGPADMEPIGNGKAAAILFAREGAKVLLVDKDRASAEDTKKVIDKEGGTCATFKADITKPEDCQAMAEACCAKFGQVDILHNNVGIGARTPGGLLEVSEEDWDLVMNINLKGMFNTCRAAIPKILQHGRGGSVINISSVGSVLHAYPKLFVYTISKAGVNTFTKCLAVEFAPKQIRVNCVMPGMIDAPVIYKEILPLYGGDIIKMRADRHSKVPLGHMGEPWDIGYASLFLASDEAKYITGQVIAVDGALTLRMG